VPAGAHSCRENTDEVKGPGQQRDRHQQRGRVSLEDLDYIVINAHLVTGADPDPVPVGVIGPLLVIHLQYDVAAAAAGVAQNLAIGQQAMQPDRVNHPPVLSPHTLTGFLDTHRVAPGQLVDQQLCLDRHRNSAVRPRGRRNRSATTALRPRARLPSGGSTDRLGRGILVSAMLKIVPAGVSDGGPPRPASATDANQSAALRHPSRDSVLHTGRITKIVTIRDASQHI
jgi:hypothetical protein